LKSGRIPGVGIVSADEKLTASVELESAIAQKVSAERFSMAAMSDKTLR
jgi:hypothetical protein